MADWLATNRELLCQGVVRDIDFGGGGKGERAKGVAGGGEEGVEGGEAEGVIGGGAVELVDSGDVGARANNLNF